MHIGLSLPTVAYFSPATIPFVVWRHRVARREPITPRQLAVAACFLAATGNPRRRESSQSKDTSLNCQRTQTNINTHCTHMDNRKARMVAGKECAYPVFRDLCCGFSGF